MLLVSAPVWSVEQAAGARTAVCAETSFWPQSLTGAYHMRPAGTGTCFTIYKQVILGNSVRLGPIRWVRQRIWGDFSLNITPLQILDCNVKDRCNFICCLSC